MLRLYFREEMFVLATHASNQAPDYIEAYPPGPAVSLERSGEIRLGMVIASQLAANLMPLSGVKNPNKGDGKTRHMTFSKFSLSMLRSGAPTSVADHELVAGAVKIHKGSLNRFGPNTLAGAVLTGANYLFDPLVEARDRNYPYFSNLSPRMRLGIAACWGFQMFREQPGLFTLGVQAWHIQRTLIHDNLRPAVEPTGQPYPGEPSTFAPIKSLPELGSTFFDLCLATAREDSALVVRTDEPGHVVPKVYAHPGDFTARFLAQNDLVPELDEVLPHPVIPEESNLALQTMAWAANDLSARISRDSQLSESFRTANSELVSRMRLTAQ